MSITNYILIGICVFVSLFLQLLCYKELTDRKLKMNLVSVSVMIICSILTVINIYFNYSFTKLIISFIIITFNCYFTFRESINYSFLKSVFIYLIIAMSEVILSVGILTFKINSLIDFDSNVLIKILFSIAVMLTSLLICKIKFIKSFSRKLVGKIAFKLSYLFYLIICLLLVTTLAYKFINSFDGKTYILNLLTLICFSVLMVLTLYSYIKTQKAIQQQETLLSFMSKYEKMIDEERVNKHEMLNNLLILRSFKNKNSKEFTEVLDDLIKSNDNIKDSIKNIYNLPPGLKGILYYKVYDMKALNIEVTINISKKINSSFKSIDSKEYNNLCKVITILLDNAKDAAAVSKEKLVLIEFYIENSDLVFSIENTFKDKVDINKLTTINYSTKGKGRGLGLFIANNIINNTNNIKLEQKIINNNIFSSILKFINKN